MSNITVCHAPNNLANNAYLNAYGLKDYGVNSYLLMPNYINEVTEMIYYGYSEMGNPYNIPIVYHTGRKDLIQKLISISKADIDILHLYGGGNFWHPIYARLAGAKVIRHFFGSDLRNLKSRRILALSLFSEDGIIVGEQNLMKNLVWKDALKKSTRMPVAVDPAFYPISKSEFPTEKIIFLPTRHDPIKNTGRAFQAWKILQEIDKDVRLFTIEWGLSCKEFKAIFGSDDRIVWMPLLSRSLYMEMLKRCSIVWGQFGGLGHGGTELEAISSGRPVFIHMEDSYREMYWNPPMIEATDAKSLAEQTKALLDDESRYKKITRQASQWIMNTHDVHYVAGLLNQYYRKILNNGV